MNDIIYEVKYPRIWLHVQYAATMYNIFCSFNL